MKRVIKKIHHFTKCELITEEILIIFLVCVVLAAVGFAANAFMPVRASIVNCGRAEDVPLKCREDQRCCTLMESTGSHGFSAGSDERTTEQRTETLDPSEDMEEIDIERGTKKDVE